MKYANTLQQELVRLPQYLQDASINYKSWKKLLQQDRLTTTDVLTKLTADCQAVHDTLAVELRASARTGHADTDTLHRYVLINATTLRKVCKRIDKCRPELACNAVTWLIRKCSDHVYNFLAGQTVTQLALRLRHARRAAIECPVCYTEADRIVNVMILKCGHYYCTSCIRRMTKRLVVPYNPAVDGLVSKYNYVICPLCNVVCDLRYSAGVLAKRSRCCP